MARGATWWDKHEEVQEKVPESSASEAGDGSYHMMGHIHPAPQAAVNGQAQIKVKEEAEGHSAVATSKDFGDRESRLWIPTLLLCAKPSLCLSLICSAGLIIGCTSKACP